MKTLTLYFMIFYTLFPPYFLMANSERKKLVSFADVAAGIEPDPGMQGFNQLTFDALSSPEQETREIENLLIINSPFA
jgi:hypothetical protein